MTKITNFNPENLKEIRDDFNEAVKQLEEKYGIRLSFDKISYSPDSFGAKINAIIANSAVTEESVNPKWIADFTRYTEFGYNGLKKSDLGRKFKFPNGKTGKIVGLRPRARHPLVVKYDDSTGYTACDIAKVLMHLI
jgi:hypothetical protein